MVVVSHLPLESRNLRKRFITRVPSATSLVMRAISWKMMVAANGGGEASAVSPMDILLENWGALLVLILVAVTPVLATRGGDGAISSVSIVSKTTNMIGVS